jgi:hypothetical protein
VTSALTRRTRWLLVAGAVVVALLVNVAWVAFGPDDGGERGRIESEIRRAWTVNGVAPRAVSCAESDTVWTCEVVSARGDLVHCPIGHASAFYTNPNAALQASCRVQ